MSRTFLIIIYKTFRLVIALSSEFFQIAGCEDAEKASVFGELEVQAGNYTI